MRKILIAPSLLAANKQNLEKEIRIAEKAGADWLHFDVMDAKFVPNTALSVEELEQVNALTHLFLDVHLMIEKPTKFVHKYIEAGADLVTFHYEAMQDASEIRQLIQIIKENGIKIGMSVKPNTPIDLIYDYLGELDLVLVMGVEPGLGGQKFIVGALDKIAKLRKIIDENNYACLIELDGGINQDTAKLCREAGVDVIVAGSYLFGKDDFAYRLELLR